MKFYSPSTLGFYDSAVHASMPDDAIEITAQDYQDLMNSCHSGDIRPSPEGLPVIDTNAQVTDEQIIKKYVSDLQLHMDLTAKAAGYDGIQTAVTYADEPSVPRFQAEGLAFRAWRSICWEYCYSTLDAVKAGRREIPSSEQLIGELPKFQLPEV